ncbi:hypothetical protein [Marinimicrobium sp. ABcell2]|uniref:hypothetical protein n=1 Tax=Marinimicrobium sp. ABcell2 TaxID=3069751 RepID=UPI0027AEFF4B|nr:hypothetical protein [Marinimicrobium sp. ABcell2]MDQ2078474.1 hypothetical protein [Marinimicrobium sp. ABcell2]
MDRDQKESLISEIETRYFLIKKSTAVYAIGGFVAAILAMAGVTYTSVLDAVRSESSEIAIAEIAHLRSQAQSEYDSFIVSLGEPNTINRKLANVSSKLGDVAALQQEVMALSYELEEVTRSLGEAARHLGVAGYMNRKFSEEDFDEIGNLRRGIWDAGAALGKASDKVGSN